YESDPNIRNCTFSGNRAGRDGGAISNSEYGFYGSRPRLTNCILWGNSDSGGTDESGQMHGGEPVVEYCCIQGLSGGLGGTGNIDSDPCFVSGPLGDYYLSQIGAGQAAESPCVDAGSDLAENFGMDNCTTRTDGVGDTGLVDMGFHYCGCGPALAREPWIWLSSRQFEFIAAVGGPNPADQILTIRNSGAGTLGWQISEDCAWVLAEPNAGTSAGEVDEIAIRVDVAALAEDRYDCVLSVTDGNAINSPQWVYVRLFVERPAIGVSAQQISFVAPEGGSNPPEKTLSIYNSGVGVLNWQIDYDCDWLSAEPNSGSSTGEMDAVSLSVDVSGLDEGSYLCELTVWDHNSSNSPQMVAVILEIRTGPVSLRVPSEYLTIQAAIDMALDGDTVIVEPGTYTGDGNKNLNFGGRAITVRSTDPDDPCVVAATVIDCEDVGRGFFFHSGEGSDSVIAGLTITRGHITEGYWEGGGAIYCYHASPTIENCIIHNNTVEQQPPWSLSWAFGGGVSCNGDSNPIIRGCKIMNNRVYGGRYYDYCDTTDPQSGGGGGGGVCSIGGSQPLIVDCLIWQNYVYGGRGREAQDGPWYCLCPGTRGGDGAGGGIYADDGSIATIVNCVVVENGAVGGDGGAMGEWGCTGGAGGTALGGGVAGDSVAMENCTVVGNWVSGGLGGQGAADGQAMGSGIDVTTLNMIDSVVWNNSGADQISSSSPDATYCDVQGGWPGTGNIDADPCFVAGPEGAYYLSQVAAGQTFDSPCVDAGSDLAQNLGMDDCTTRTDEISDAGIVDMGYHYGECYRLANPADTDGDKDVDFVDYALLTGGWDVNCSMTIPMGAVVVDGNLGEWSEALEWVRLDKVYHGSPNDVSEAW
ncbi:MAG: right-handed parallel beta-helix repeat-containing protein, partial [Planctomycetota bacterium]